MGITGFCFLENHILRGNRVSMPKDININNLIPPMIVMFNRDGV